MRNTLVDTGLIVLVSAVCAWAQPSLMEPPEFPAGIPGPSASHSGLTCLHLAHGMIEPGDVDWVQVTIDIATERTIVDVDFSDGESSALLASVVGGSSGFNVDDNNNAIDAFCGLSGDSDPLGSPTDSAANLGATQRGAVIDIGVTGAEDTGFNGSHARTFEYDVWVYVLPVPCTQDADCDDGVDCTTDTCQVKTGLCESAPDDTLCDDGVFCNGPEYCDAAAGCQSGDSPLCDDGVDCTVDTCDTALDACAATPDHAACDDGAFCTGTESCDAAQGCLGGDDPCLDAYCDEEGDRCLECLADADCDDGVFCNGGEICDAAGVCTPGESPCEPGQMCDPTTDQCVAGEAGLTLDIKAGACPNRYRPDGRGFLHAALVAADGFDVALVDTASLLLSRTDGIGGVVSPAAGPPGPRVVITDITAPHTGGPCECGVLPADGWPDLLMKFDDQDVVDALLLADEPHDAVIELTVSGMLADGNAFAATDCVTIKEVKRRGR